MALHRLLFDSANPSDGANVGAHLIASGTQLSATGTALDVSAVFAAGSEIQITDGTETLLINVDGSINAVVSATDLDIRSLAFATDTVDVSGSVNVAVVDGGGSLTVDAVDLDIRDLAAATDSVAAYLNDSAGNAIGSTAGALDVNISSSVELDVSDSALADAAISSAAESVTTTSAALITSILSGRKYLSLYNNGNKEVFVGPSGVSTASGFPLFPGSILEARIGAAVAVHAVSIQGTQDVRTLQLS